MVKLAISRYFVGLRDASYCKFFPHKMIKHFDVICLRSYFSRVNFLRGSDLFFFTIVLVVKERLLDSFVFGSLILKKRFLLILLFEFKELPFMIGSDFSGCSDCSSYLDFSGWNLDCSSISFLDLFK